MASGDTLLSFEALSGVPPSSTTAAALNRRGSDGHMVYQFDASTAEAVDFPGVLPRHYSGGGLTLTIIYMMASATSGNVVWNAAIERHSDDDVDLDSSQFAAANAVTDAVPNVAGEVGYATITFTDGADMDSLAVGEHFRLRVSRDASNGSDTATGDAELLAVEIRET